MPVNPLKPRIIYMGTPDFAVLPLKKLIDNAYDIAAVVTVPDKKSGRGQKITQSAVKQFAVEKKIPVLQPENLKSQEFIDVLKEIKPDIIIVVAFRMLPEQVWSLPSKGTFNLHASLLPQYRGAAPINWVLINGEKETGVTTFFIDKKIDTGNIILQKKISVSFTDNAKSLHDKLMIVGAELIIETVEKIIHGNIEAIPQNVFETEHLKKAPKIYKDDCEINWQQNGEHIYNFIRGLSPSPGAWTKIIMAGKKMELKIFDGQFEYQLHNKAVGTILIHGKDNMSIAVPNGIYKINSLQLQNKKQMSIREFLNGFGKYEMGILR